MAYKDPERRKAHQIARRGYDARYKNAGYAAREVLGLDWHAKSSEFSAALAAAPAGIKAGVAALFDAVRAPGRARKWRAPEGGEPGKARPEPRRACLGHEIGVDGTNSEKALRGQPARDENRERNACV
jgi:hypothetical protein